MLPKRRGRPPKHAQSNNENQNAVTGMASTSETPATPKKKVGADRKGKGKVIKKRNDVPDVYREMLAEALPSQSDSPERPLKRRKTGKRDTQVTTSDPVTENIDEEDDGDVEFEDVLVSRGEPEQASSDEDAIKQPLKLQQTAYRDSDESEEEEEDFDWEGIDLGVKPGDVPASGDLELTLTKRPEPKIATPRRRVVSKEDKVIRLTVHKMHVLCLLSVVDKRNEWINDPATQGALKSLVDKKTLSFLQPRKDLSQFSQTESLKRGLEQACNIWRTKYQITERGMRRALWADDENDITNYELPEDSDTVIDKSGFQQAAKTLKGSRDVGAQLFCALLRSISIETRLVCSLQALSFNAGGPSMPRAPKKRTKPATPKVDRAETRDIENPNFSFGSSSLVPVPGVALNPRSRLGHPNAADYFMPETSTVPRPKPPSERKPIEESPHPVFWVEVFNEAHQKWLSVDPQLTGSVAKQYTLEPPASDRENSMVYVIAFEEEGCARDVTRRYTKYYNAKTRKNRVNSTPGGEKWWRRAMGPYARGYSSDPDQIEDAEFAKAEAQEPMPKNIQDFKDHPYYALERHLRRHEVLISTRSSGTVAAGRDPNNPKLKKLENIYRRSDVKIARSANAWYRLGRDIKLGEQPVKTLEPRKKVDPDEMDDEDERAGTNLYSEAQTELCSIPPVVDGRIPKNRYGNLDVYVPTMVPPGGVHLPFEEAKLAARILSIDYANAVTGFEFRGRHGTAIVKGVVVAAEYREAVEAVMEGLRDEQARAEDDMRKYKIEKMWKRLLVGLRIRERVSAYGGDDFEDEGVRDEGMHEGEGDDVDDVDDVDSDASEYIEDEGGGFFPE